MKPFTRFTGIIAPLDAENIDIDTIIPENFSERGHREHFGDILFYKWRYQNGEEHKEFVLNKEPYRNAPILLTRKNFGTGAAKKQAHKAIADYGIRVILAPQFSDFFYHNCFAQGLLPIELPEKDIDFLFKNSLQHPGYQLSIDLENEKVEDSFGYVSTFNISSANKNLLLKEGIELGSAL